ncbi:hypothetical protein Scep_015742 [Stephania cephalantha]|uniref:Uncharacterized protein n=1 Tax=Stephania cephalantha TaxID=152367 RepID=A0AAP0P464_9MAGN
MWKELEKENKEFFEAYGRSREERNAMDSETLESMIHNLHNNVSPSSSSSSSSLFR